MTLLVLLGLVGCLLGSVVAQKPLFSSETAYDDSFDLTGRSQRAFSWIQLAQISGQTSPEGLENCSPVSSYVVYREGTSFPDQADTMALNAFQNRLRATPVSPTFAFLNRIPNRITPRNVDQLSEAGRTEIMGLATRLKSRFTELFSVSDIDLSKVEFRTTNSSSAIASAEAFVQGLVGQGQICQTVTNPGNVTMTCTENARLNTRATPTTAYIPYDPSGMDEVLLPYETKAQCLNAANRHRTHQQTMAFQNGPQFQQLARKISQKLTPQGRQPWNITHADVELLAKACGLHLALFKDNSSWCRLFEFEDLNVAEYIRDLRHYWEASHGFLVNSRVACPLINDTFTFLEQFATRGRRMNNMPSVRVQFTDDNTLMRLISLLGINKEQRQVLANNYEQNRQRTFRSGKMVPFGGNLAVNMYRCQESASLFFNEQKYRVQVLLNELPVNISFCRESFCEVNMFRQELMKQAGHCNTQRDCNLAMGLGPTGEPLPGSGVANQFSHVFISLSALVAMIVTKFFAWGR